MRTTLNVPINFQKQNPKFLFVAFLPQSLFALSIAPSGSASPQGERVLGCREVLVLRVLGASRVL